MGVAAGIAEGAHLVVERLPIAGEDVGAGDDDVDLGGAGSDRGFNFGDALLERRKPGREACRDGGDGDAAAFEGAQRGLQHGVIDADRADLDGVISHAQCGQDVFADGLAGLGAQARDFGGSVIARQRGEVDGGDGLEQPGRLPVFFDRAARRDRGGAAFDGAAIDADIAQQVELERGAGIARRVLLRCGLRARHRGDVMAAHAFSLRPFC